MQTNSQQELESLRLKELQQRYHQVVGEETRCPNRVFLIRRILAAVAVAAASPGTSPSAPTAEAPRPSQPSQEDSPLVQAVLAAQPPSSTHEQASVARSEVVAASTLEAAPPSATESTRPLPESLPIAPAASSMPETSAAEQAQAPVGSWSEVPASAPAGQPAEPDAATNATPLEPWVPSDHELSAAEANTAARAPRRRGRFSGMTIAELQALYVAKVGRTTGSDDRRYLEWKIREAEKGHIPVGPREARAPAQEATSDVRILPLRLEASAVEALDAAWKSKGMKSRMELFRRALGHYLAHIGAPGAAAHFAGSHAT